MADFIHDHIDGYMNETCTYRPSCTHSEPQPGFVNLSLRIMSRQINQEWIRSDLYHNSYLIRDDDGLEHAKVNSAENELPEIAVSAAQGKLLNLYARSIGAKRILEVGTLGG